MDDVPRYLRWISLLCVVMAAFGVGVFLIGYQGPSVGRVATVVALLVAAAALFLAARRLEGRR